MSEKQICKIQSQQHLRQSLSFAPPERLDCHIRRMRGAPQWQSYQFRQYDLFVLVPDAPLFQPSLNFRSYRG